LPDDFTIFEQNDRLRPRHRLQKLARELIHALARNSVHG